jgi:hypothetical protein
MVLILVYLTALPRNSSEEIEGGHRTLSSIAGRDFNGVST